MVHPSSAAAASSLPDPGLTPRLRYGDIFEAVTEGEEDAPKKDTAFEEDFLRPRLALGSRSEARSSDGSRQTEATERR